MRHSLLIRVEMKKVVCPIGAAELFIISVYLISSLTLVQLQPSSVVHVSTGTVKVSLFSSVGWSNHSSSHESMHLTQSSGSEKSRIMESSFLWE